MRESSALFQGLPQRDLQPGQIIIRPGDSAARVYNVHAGLLMTSRTGTNGGRQVLAFLFPKQLLGLTSASKYWFQVEAILPSQVVAINRQDLQARLADNPELQGGFIDALYQMLDRSRDQVFSLGQRTATERVAVFLLYLRHEGLLSHSTWASDNELGLPMARTEIADFLGLKAETISRRLTELESKGCIRRQGQVGIQFTNIDELRRIAGVVDFTSADSVVA